MTLLLESTVSPQTTSPLGGWNGGLGQIYAALKLERGTGMGVELLRRLSQFGGVGRFDRHDRPVDLSILGQQLGRYSPQQRSGRYRFIMAVPVLD